MIVLSQISFSLWSSRMLDSVSPIRLFVAENIASTMARMVYWTFCFHFCLSFCCSSTAFRLLGEPCALGDAFLRTGMRGVALCLVMVLKHSFVS